MLKQFRLALGSYLVAHRFIFKHKIWAYAVIPTLINIFMIAGLLYSAFQINDNLKPHIQSWFSTDYKTLSTITNYTIQVLVNLVIFIGYFFIYKNLVLIILSPFLAILSEKVDALYTGREFPFNGKQLLLDVWRGIKISVRNSAIELGLIFLCFLIGFFIPIVGFLIPIAIFLIESFYFGFSMIDYTNERKKLTFKESKTYIRQNKPLAYGIGIVFYLMFLIPLIGWIFAPLYGIVAGTLAVLQNDKTQAPYMD